MRYPTCVGSRISLLGSLSSESAASAETRLDGGLTALSSADIDGSLRAARNGWSGPFASWLEMEMSSGCDSIDSEPAVESVSLPALFAAVSG